MSGTIYSTRDAAGTGNGEIECGGIRTAAFYGLQIFVAGKGGPETPVHAKNGVTLDLTAVVAISTTPPATAPSGDQTYVRMDGANSPVTGAISFTNLGATIVNAEVQFKGPNPYRDVRRDNVRAKSPTVVPQIPGITANCTSGSAVVTISAASDFQNGDGVTVFGCGAPHALATPAAPVVTPSVASNMTGTRQTVAAADGATTRSYKISARTKQGGWTPASPVGTTTVGRAALGSQSVAITSHSRSGTTVTVTTTAPHGLVVGAMAKILGASEGSFIGDRTVVTVPNNTTFTYSSGMDTAAGAATSAIGGTVFWFVADHLDFPLVAGVFEYAIFDGVSNALLGVSWPESGFITTAPGWDNFGTTMMGGILLPFHAPTTAPTAATSNPLVTTIVSGASTTTLTLAAAAGTTVTGATILFDNGPNIVASATAANAVNTAIVIPRSGTTAQYVINSYTTLPSGTDLVLAGNLYLNDTIELGQFEQLQGQLMPVSGTSAPNFSWQTGATIVVNRANPGIYGPGATAAVGNTFSGITFQSTTNNSLLVAGEALSNWVFERVNFDTSGAGVNDYMSTGLLMRSNVANNMFSNIFRQVVFVGGPGISTYGSTATPLWIAIQAGMMTATDLNFSRRGAYVSAQNSGADFRISGGRIQGGIMPMLTVTGVNGTGGYFEVGMEEIDTGQHPLVAYMPACSICTNSFRLSLIGGNSVPSADTNGVVQGALTGAKFTGGVTTNLTGFSPANLGQNTGVKMLEPGQFAAPGENISTFGTGTIGYQLAVPAAPTATGPTAGGAVPVGQVRYKATAVDANNVDTTLGLVSATITTTTGNQTVTVAPPALPAGSVGWRPWRELGAVGSGYVLANVPGSCASSIAPGVSFVDSFGFACGIGPIAQNFATASSISSSGIVSPQIKSRNYNNTRLVDPANSAGWSGAEPGAWITSAFADIGGAGTVVLAPGTYSATSVPNPSTTGQHLVGSGIGVTIYQYTGTTAIAAVIDVGTAADGTANKWNMSVENMTIRGNANSTNALRIRGVHHSAFRNLSLRDVTGSGLQTNFAIANVYDNIHTSSNEAAFTTVPANCMIFDGPDGAHQSTASEVINPVCEGVSGDGLSFRQAARIGVFGGTSEGNSGRGANVLVTATDISFDGVDFESNTTEDLLIASTAILKGATVCGSTTRLHVAATGLVIRNTSTTAAGTICTPTVDAGGNVILADINMVLGTPPSRWVIDNAVQTLTSKTLTSPTVTNPAISGTAGSGYVTPAFLTANFTNATTVMANVTGLSFSVAASKNYKIRCDLAYQSSALTSGIQTQWTGPAAPTSVTYDQVDFTASAGGSDNLVATAFSTALSGSVVTIINNNFVLTTTMTLRNGVNAGTIQLQAAATGVGTVTIIPGSCIMYQ